MLTIEILKKELNLTELPNTIEIYVDEILKRGPTKPSLLRLELENLTSTLENSKFEEAEKADLNRIKCAIEIVLNRI